MGLMESYYYPFSKDIEKCAKEIYDELYNFFNKVGITQQSFGIPRETSFDDYPSNTFLIVENGEFFRANIKGGHFRKGGNRIYLNVEYTELLPLDIMQFIEKFNLIKEEDTRLF